MNQTLARRTGAVGAPLFEKWRCVHEHSQVTAPNTEMQRALCGSSRMASILKLAISSNHSLVRLRTV
jgi:hypothetical protein